MLWFYVPIVKNKTLLLLSTIALLALSSCIIAPDNQGNINIIIGGDNPDVNDPDTYSVSGYGVYFRGITQVLDYSWYEATITLKNIGSKAIDAIYCTVDWELEDGSSGTSDDLSEWWSEDFSPGEYKTLDFNVYSSSPFKTISIISAKINPSDYNDEDVVLLADPVIVFTF